MAKIAPTNPEPGMNHTSSTDDELNPAGQAKAQQARQAGGSAGTGSTSGPTGGDSTEVVPSERGDVQVRDQRKGNWISEILDDAKNLGSGEPDKATTGNEPADYWKGLLDAGKYDEILNAAMTGNESARKWLEDPINSAAFQRKIQQESLMHQAISNIMRSQHEMAMAAVRNIKA